MNKVILFEKANCEHLNAILSWLAEPHVQEFWDNIQAHKDDIINFVEGRKSHSSYAHGRFVYWVAKAGDEPFALIMTIQETHKSSIASAKLEHLSKTGHTYSIDYMIGNPNYLGRGYGAKTLIEFVDYFRKAVDPKADVFFIDPASDNKRAKHVYIKAGFKYMGNFIAGRAAYH